MPRPSACRARTAATSRPAQREIWDHVVETRKLDFMPNMFAVMGKSPEALQGGRGRGRARPLALGIG